MLAMSERINSLFVGVLAVLDGGYIFIIALALELILFTAVILLSCLKRLYSLKKRGWYFISALAVLGLELSFLSFTGELGFFYFTLAFTLGLWCAVFLIPERRLKVSDKQRELARQLDEKALRVESDLQEEGERAPTPQPLPAGLDETARFELDFQHVKLVIQKLEYYPLCASDKKLVRELEENICQAENEGFTHALKNKINDGLGALLKIMSKYGV